MHIQLLQGAMDFKSTAFHQDRHLNLIETNLAIGNESRFLEVYAAHRLVIYICNKISHMNSKNLPDGDRL
ncbi:MAG: hypothetical protein CVU50_08730 [Candidatus Cloacimonetes bacterium HGW-Cloacimonetes-3]|nr:MAG: hypothetical protein CVU50_08730 [Candidatus Cloacimonetes bacterium HGW-Cloacimonetes-3]